MNKNFYILVIGYFITNLGVKIGYTGQLLNSYSITKTVLGISILLASKMIITMLFNPVIFKIIDKKSKKTIILTCQIVNVIISIFLIQFSGNYFVFLLLSALISLNNAFFNPAFRGIVPLVVSKDKIGKANSYISLSDSLLTLVGFSLAGLISFGIGYNATFFVDGFTSLIAILVLLGIKENRVEKNKEKKRKKELKYLEFYKKINKELIFPTWSFFFWTVGGFLSATEIPFVKSFILLNDRSVGLLLSFSALGGILASKLFSKVKIEKQILEKKYKIYFLAMFLIPIIYSYTSLIWVAFIISFFSGIIFVSIRMIVSTYINSFYEVNEQGKIFSIMHMINHTGMAFGIILSGILAKYMNLSVLYRGYPIFIIALFLSTLFFLKKNKLKSEKISIEKSI
jgi:MFS family permease